MAKALVLSGGSIKGAFQAGAISRILRKGFIPDVVYGISVGSLNSVFMADRVGKYIRDQQDLDVMMPLVGTELVSFWRDNVRSFKDLGKKKGKFKLAWNIVFSKFSSILEMKGLNKIVNKHIDLANVQKSLLRIYIGSVNVDTGDFQINTNEDDDIIKYVLASTRIPIIMPIEKIGNNHFVDGGVRNIATLKQAIDDGADEIVVISCQADDPHFKKFNHKSFFEYADRIIGIMTNEIIHDDLDQELRIVESINKAVADGTDTKHRFVKVTIVRPLSPLHVDIESFTRQDISNMIEHGDQVADAQYQREE